MPEGRKRGGKKLPTEHAFSDCAHAYIVDQCGICFRILVHVQINLFEM